MHHGFDSGWFTNVPFWALPFFGIVALAAVWSLVWKGLGLWHASRNGDNWWFVAILLINTLGILEIVYLFFIAKMKFDQLFTKGPHHHRTHAAHHEHHAS